MDSMRDLGNGREKNFEKGLTKDERKNQKLLFRMFVNTAEVSRRYRLKMVVKIRFFINRPEKDRQKHCV